MRRSSASQRIIGLLGVGILLVVLGSIGWLKPVKSTLDYAGGPFAKLFNGAGSTINGWWEIAGSAGSLAHENQRLKDENASLRQQISQNTEIKAQNAELRRQLNVGGLPPDTLIAAEVIGYQPDNFRQFITIARGRKDGLQKGMAVVSQGALVGTVDEVGATTSKVFLLIDPNFRVTALDQDAPDRPTGTIRGQLGSGLIMDKIAQNQNVSVGDTVITSGVGSEIPKGLIIGRIQTVSKQDNGVFQSAQVTTNIAFNRLEIVYVVVR